MNKWIPLIIVVAIIVGIILYTYFRVVFEEVYHISRKYILSITTIKKPLIKAPYFNRKFTGMKNSFPFVAAIAIDINNDGKESLFIGGGENQDDMLLDVVDGKLVNIIKGTGLSSMFPTYGGISIDLDNDRYSDLIVAREDGVTLYMNNKNGTFRSKKLMNSAEDTVPIAVAAADFNKDGIVDLYISNFIKSGLLKNYQFNNPEHSKPNVLLQGVGNGNYMDVTAKQGVAGLSNTFTSVFADLNNDTHPDLVVANDAGEIDIYENKKGQFVKRKIDAGYGFWMGIGVGDYDNDGDLDLFLSNVSDYSPHSMTKGTPETGLQPHQRANNNHIILRNDGNFKFVDVTDTYLKNKLGFGWSGVFEDIDLDGKLDLLFGVNYMKHPYHKYIKHVQPVMMNQGKNKPFKQNYQYSDTGFGHTPMLIDLDNDNIKDVVWVNIMGPLKIYSNKNYKQNNFINVKLPSTVKYTNAKIYVTMDNGQVLMRENIQGGIGFGGDQSNIHTFGLGKHKVKNVVVRTIYGKTHTLLNPKTNSTVVLKNK